MYIYINVDQIYPDIIFFWYLQGCIRRKSSAKYPIAIPSVPPCHLAGGCLLGIQNPLLHHGVPGRNNPHGDGEKW
jgi:hypothetical protein